MYRKKILVPVDFHETSYAAFKYAREIALKTNAKISCLYVIEESGYITSGFISKEIQESIRREAESKLAELANQILGADYIPYDIIVSRGKVYKKISDVAKQTDADLIVMGRANRNENKYVKIGSNAFNLIRDSKIPVITIVNEKSFTGKNLLLPVNLSEPVKSKIEKTIEIAGMFQMEVILISISGKQSPEQSQLNQMQLEKIKEIFIQKDIQCSYKLYQTYQPIPKALNEIAQKNESEIIVVMTQHEIEFMDYFISSTAQQIIDQSNIPTLSIIPQADFGPDLEEEFRHLLDPLGVSK